MFFPFEPPVHPKQGAARCWDETERISFLSIPMKRKLHLFLQRAVACGLAAASTIIPCRASSHREAPFHPTKTPKLDGADFYVHELRDRPVELRSPSSPITCPLQDAYGGPEDYFQLDENGLYEIEIDNTGDAQEDLTFQFRHQNNAQ